MTETETADIIEINPADKKAAGKRKLHEKRTSEVISFFDLVVDPGDRLDFKNPRKRYDKAEVAKLAENIAEEGIKNPLQVWQTQDKRGQAINVVLGGQRRMIAIEQLESQGKVDAEFLANIPVRVTRGATVTDARVAAFRDNEDAERMTDYDATVAVWELVDTYGLSQKEACKRTGKSTTWVSRRLSAYKNASPETLKAWEAQKIPAELAQAIAKVKDHKEQNKLLTKTLKQREAEKNSNKGAATARRSLEEEGLVSRAPSKVERSEKRAAAKGKGKAAPLPKGAKPTPDQLRQMVEQSGKSKDPYVKGLHDCLLFALGELPAGKLGRGWQAHVKKLGLHGTDRKTPRKPAAKKAPAKKKTAAKKTPRKPAAKKAAAKKPAVRKKTSAATTKKRTTAANKKRTAAKRK